MPFVPLEPEASSVSSASSAVAAGTSAGSSAWMSDEKQFISSSVNACFTDLSASLSRPDSEVPNSKSPKRSSVGHSKYKRRGDRDHAHFVCHSACNSAPIDTLCISFTSRVKWHRNLSAARKSTHAEVGRIEVCQKRRCRGWRRY